MGEYGPEKTPDLETFEKKMRNGKYFQLDLFWTAVI